MKAKHRYLQRSAVGALCLLLGGYALRAGLLHRDLSTQSASAAAGPELIPGKSFDETRLIRFRALAQLNALWKQRDTKNIVRDVLPFVKHPLQTVQLPAVKMIGRLENPAALQALKSIKVRVPNNNDLLTEGYAAPLPLNFAVPLAIGRIQSRALKGRSKVEAVLNGMSLSFDELAAFTAQIAKDTYGANKVGNRVVEEILDVLYAQKRKGEDIASIAQQLRLRPGQKLFLEMAQSSPEQQAKTIIDYLTHPGPGSFDAGWLVQHLLDLGPKARRVAFDYSDQIRRNRKKYPSSARYRYLDVLMALALDGEDRAKSLLTTWKRDSDPQTAGLAENYLFRLSAKVPF